MSRTLTLQSGPPATEGRSSEFLWTLDQAADRDYLITFSTVDGSATGGTDYAAYTTADYLIRAGEHIGTFTFPTLTDSLTEGNETFSLVINDGDGLTLANSSVTNTISDPVSPTTLTVSDGRASEGGKIDFVWTLDTAADREYWLYLNTADGTATGTESGGGDFLALGSYSTRGYKILPGERTGTFTVQTLRDPITESDETFSLEVRSSGDELNVVNASATGTIVDAEPVTLTLTVGSNTENLPIPVTWSLDHPADRTYQLVFNTVDGTATGGVDYTAWRDFNWQINAGETSGSFNIATAADRVTEGDETFSVVVSNTDGLTLANSSATASIVDVPIADDSRTLTIRGGSVTEGGLAEFIWSLDQPADAPYTLTYSTFGGTASYGTDYLGATNETFRILTGQQTGSLYFQTLNDNLLEDDETLVFHVVDGDGMVVANADATITITDGAPLTLTVIESSGEERDGVWFSWTLNRPADKDYTFTYSTLDGTALAGPDYWARSNASYTITAGQSAGFILVPTVYDGIVDEPDETFTLVLADGGELQFANTSVTGTIINTPLPEVSVTGGSAVEADFVRFTLTLNRQEWDTRYFWVSTVPTTATPGLDYTPLTDKKVSILTGRTQVYVDVLTQHDTLSEEDETFELVITRADEATIATGSATGTIINVDPIHLTIENATATEGGTLDFTWSLSQPANGDYTLTFSTADGTATGNTDFTPYTDITYVIHAAQTVGTISIPTYKDDLEESPESMSLTRYTDPFTPLAGS